MKFTECDNLGDHIPYINTNRILSKDKKNIFPVKSNNGQTQVIQGNILITIEKEILIENKQYSLKYIFKKFIEQADNFIFV